MLWLVTAAGSWYSRAYLAPGPNVQVPGYSAPALSGLPAALAAPVRADALWYLKISTQGYRASDGTAAFFPAFPAMTWAVDRLVKNETAAGLLVANLATVAGLMMMFAFARRVSDERAARTAVVGIALFPTAFFLIAPYGESILLAAGAGALLAAQRGRQEWSFGAGVIAALARPFGFALALPLAALVAGGKGKRRWVAPSGPLVGLGLWAAYVWRLTGDPAGLVSIQSNWQRQPLPFWRTLSAGFVIAVRTAGSGAGPYFTFDLAATIFGLVLIPGVVFALRKAKPGLGPALAFYGAATLAAPLSLPFLPRPLMSMPRFVLALFPLFIALGLLPGRVRVALAVASAAGLFAASAAFTAGRPLF